MSPDGDRKSPPESSPGPDGDLQPGWRDEFRGSSTSEHLERLVADVELLNDVRVQGFDGPAYWELVKALVEYGYQVIGSWIRTGLVFAKLREKGISHYLARYPKRIPPARAAEEMTHDVVADAITAFRDNVLIPSKWDPRKGASLPTYFIGQCLFRFPQNYIEWLRASSHNGFCRPPDELPMPQRGGMVTFGDPSEIATIRSQLRQARATVPPETIAILMLKHRGYSHPEIAQILETTVGAVESRLHRHKKDIERVRLHDSA